MRLNFFAIYKKKREKKTKKRKEKEQKKRKENKTILTLQNYIPHFDGRCSLTLSLSLSYSY